ncbi:MAG: pyridoxamine 5'-phosphate oxidase family protein [Acidobacteria bacterium]|nr:pyridoxamine 5'-phosphate oxidase family protein [Acidobacteriota bacterium]
MSTHVGDRLPDDLFAALSGGDLTAVADCVIVVSTVDEHGFPHPALLSYFEVVAIDPRTIRLATYADSRSTRNATRGGKLTLVFVDAAFVYYVKGAIRPLAASMRSTPYNAKLEMRVEEVLRDAPDPVREPGAHIASGIRYLNPQRSAELARARDVIAELRE